MRIPLTLWLFVSGMVLSTGLLAQQEEPYRQQLEWKQRQTENFTLYYPAGSDETAGLALRYAEESRYDLGILLDYKPDGPHTLVYLPHNEAWLYSPFSEMDPSVLPGRINLPDHYGLIIHPGNQADLYREVRRQVARVILKELYYGYELGSVTQTAMLYYDADWFSEGLADYLGYGWTFEDEQIVKTLTAYQMLELAQEGNGYLNRISRRSIWHFITHEYGDQKLREIIYLANISHSIEAGIISVLGITLNSLTRRWQQFIQKRFRQQLNGRMELAELNEAIHLPQRKGESIASFAHDPHGSRVAVFFNHAGLLELYLYDEESRMYEATPIRTGLERMDGDALPVYPQIAWSHDGRTIATTIYDQNGYQLAFYNLPTEEVTYHELPERVEAITHLAWAYEDDRLVYSVRHEGQSDLWIAPKNSVNFVALTNDAYDDLDPTWSLDDQFIFFASNRDTTLRSSEGSQLYSYRENLDLFKLPIKEEAEELVRLTRTPDINESFPQPSSSFEVLYVSDAAGIPNLRKLNIFQLTDEPLSNLAIGVDAYQVYEDRLLIRQFCQGVSELYLMPLSALSVRQEPTPTLLRLAYEVAFEQEQQKLKREAEKAKAEAEPEVEPEPDTVESVTPEPETAPAPPVRYYIFDEEPEPYEVRNATNSTQPRQEGNPRNPRITTTVFGQDPAPKLEEIEVSRGKNAKSTWRNDYFGVNLVYDPFARIGSKFEVGYSDLFQRHSIRLNYTPFFNISNFLRNHLFDAEYVYKPGRIDWFGKVGYMTRQARELSNLPSGSFQQDSVIFRFNQYNLQAGGRYALSSFASVEASLGYYNINRVDQKLLREQRLEDSDQLIRAGVGIRYRRVEETQGFAIRGLAASAGFNSYYSLSNGEFAFHRVMGQLLYYRPVYNKIVLALRLEGSFNIPKEVEQYYLGGVDNRLMMLTSGQSGENLVDPQLDSAIYRTHFMNYATPIRGFRNAVRSGSRYLISNVELRIPVSRLLKSSLSSNRLYNLELIPFVDIGAVWVEGNPFSQKKPTDTQFIPMGTQGPFAIKLQTLKSPFLVGFGSGARINILTWSMRADLAWGVDDYSVQRPSLTLSVGHNF